MWSMSNNSPFGGMPYVVVQAPQQDQSNNNRSRSRSTPRNSNPFGKKPKSFKKQLKDAQKMQLALDEHLEWIKKNMKKDEKKEEKKEENKLTLIQKSALLFMTAPFLGLIELYLIKEFFHL